MRPANKSQRPLDQLVRLASGDVDLVQQAVKASRKSPSEPADPSKVVAYILKKRRGPSLAGAR
jgi:hypothetical protein